MEFNEMFEIKQPDQNANKSPENNYLKHYLIRVLAFVLTIILTYLGWNIVESGSDTVILGTLYMSVFFLMIWSIYLLLEGIILFIKGKKEVIAVNLVAFITIVLPIYIYGSSLH